MEDFHWVADDGYTMHKANYLKIRKINQTKNYKNIFLKAKRQGKNIPEGLEKQPENKADTK